MNLKVFSSIFYGILGLIVVFLNKTVLTTYKFPAFSVLGALQALTIVIVLRTAKYFELVSFPDLSTAIVKQIFPLPIFYIIPSKRAAMAIFVIIVGSLFAAFEDLNFDLIGYIFILAYDLFDSCEAILVKLQLNDRKSLGQVGILYYCALFSVAPLVVYIWSTGDFSKAFVTFDQWQQPSFVCLFFSCGAASAVFLYAYIMCTDYNNPVLSQVIACMRNILTTYIGMYIGGDYTFNFYNFVALNVTMCAAFYYTYINVKENSSVSKTVSKEDLVNEV